MRDFMTLSSPEAAILLFRTLTKRITSSGKEDEFKIAPWRQRQKHPVITTKVNSRSLRFHHVYSNLLVTLFKVGELSSAEFKE